MDDNTNIMAAANAAIDAADQPRAATLNAWADDLDYMRLSDVQPEHQAILGYIAEFLRRRAALEPAPIADGVIEVQGKQYMRDAKGGLTPVELIKAKDKLMDEVVRKIVGYADPLSAQVARFRQHSFDDVDQLFGLLGQNYGVDITSQKGNRTLTSIDGLLQVKVQIADQIVFGPELEAAKANIDECLKSWTAESGAELRVIVDKAFQVDKAGNINRSLLLGLRTYDIKHPRWTAAMEAINDSIRVVGSKRYIRCYRRASQTANWEAIVIDVAAA